jgi:cellulose synthase/poly-beta-1,6-N-acetylglucosamine synthase-like glycosyltransferase
VSARVRTVVAAWGASPRLAAALDAIERATAPFDGETFVVGTDISGKAGATLVAPDPALPSTPGAHRNQGARGATAPYLLFADDDVVVEPEFVARAVAMLDAEPRVVGVGGRIHERQWQDGKLVREIPDLHKSGTGGDVEMLAAAWLARRTAFEAAGGFDPRLPAEEDMELCLRLAEAGGRVVALDLRAAYHDCRPRPSLAEIRRRWSSGLFAGQGLLLRQSWGTKAFARHFARQRLYLATFAYAALGVLLAIATPFGAGGAFGLWTLGATGAWAAMALKKKSLALGGLSILAWLALGAGIVRAWASGTAR